MKKHQQPKLVFLLSRSQFDVTLELEVKVSFDTKVTLLFDVLRFYSQFMTFILRCEFRRKH